jgi:PEP-CTERM motif
MTCYQNLCLAMLATGLIAPSASATQIYVSDMQLSNGYEMVGFQPNDPAGPWAGGTEYTGQQVLTANFGDTYDPSHLFNIYAWCVDVFDNIYLGGNNIVYNLASPGVPHYDDIENVAAWGDAILAAGPNPLISAAVQAEIWDLEYNMSITVPNPGDPLDPITILANEVTNIDAMLSSLPEATGFELTGSFVGGGPAQSLYTTQVPEPAGIALLASGMMALFVARRKAAAG